MFHSKWVSISFFPPLYACSSLSTHSLLSSSLLSSPPSASFSHIQDGPASPLQGHRTGPQVQPLCWGCVPHVDTILPDHADRWLGNTDGMVRGGKEGVWKGERGTLTGTQYHSAMAKWKGGRERGGGPHRATIPFSHINQLTEPDWQNGKEWLTQREERLKDEEECLHMDITLPTRTKSVIERMKGSLHQTSPVIMPVFVHTRRLRW